MYSHMKQRRLGSEIWTKCPLAIKLHLLSAGKETWLFNLYKLKTPAEVLHGQMSCSSIFLLRLTQYEEIADRFSKPNLQCDIFALSCLWVVSFSASLFFFFFSVWVLLTDLKFMEATSTCGNVKHHATLFVFRKELCYGMLLVFLYYFRIFFILQYQDLFHITLCL